jgi:hypothetical protein
MQQQKGVPRHANPASCLAGLRMHASLLLPPFNVPLTVIIATLANSTSLH